MKELLNYTAEPESKSELLFMKYFKLAWAGDDLFEIVEREGDEYDNMTSEELKCIITGYSLGQKRHNMDFTPEELIKLTPSHDDDVH